MIISKKCHRAFILLSDKTLSSRVRSCENVSEYGFALLLRYVQLEAALKVLRYWYKLKDGWPDRLDFLQANWTPLRDLKASDPAKYASLIGASGRSLREIRNQIAHEGHSFNESEYNALASVADWALRSLRARLPTSIELRAKLTRVRNRDVKMAGSP